MNENLSVRQFLSGDRNHSNLVSPPLRVVYVVKPILESDESAFTFLLVADLVCILVKFETLATYNTSMIEIWPSSLI